MTKSALVILHSGFEELEAVAPIDLMSRAGIDTTLAAIGDSLTVTGRSNISIEADLKLKELSEKSLFDIVVLPGGPGINQIRNHDGICNLFRRHVTEGKCIACICAAPLLLQDAGLIDEATRYTAFPATKSELENATDEIVVQDGQIITSKGAGTATEFGLKIIQATMGVEQAETIASSICWPHS